MRREIQLGFIDGQNLEPGRTIDADLCVAGSIVAGLAAGVGRGAELFGAPLPPEDHPFTGFVRGAIPRGPYTAYGLVDGGRGACRIGPVVLRGG